MNDFGITLEPNCYIDGRRFLTMKLKRSFFVTVLMGALLSFPIQRAKVATSPGLHYRLDAQESRFMVRAFAGGLLWFKGQDHFIAIRNFSGEAEITPDTITPASLRITARADSLVETRDVFTEQEKQIINKELREIVLEPDKYPEITFRSTEVAGKKIADDRYELKITGNLTFRGTTRRIVIPTEVTTTGTKLRAQGEFSIERSDFNIKATSAVHGLVRIRDRLKFTFDISGHRI